MNDKIELYRVRSFGEKIDDTFRFARQNWKALLRFLLYLAMPISLVEALSLSSLSTHLMGGNYDLSFSSVIAAEALYIIVACVMMIVVQALVYSLIKVYETDTDLQTLTMHQLWPTLRHSLWRSLAVSVVAIILSVVIYALVFLPTFVSPFFIFVTGILGMVLTIPLLMLAPAYLLDDDCGIIEAVQHAYRYGIKTFWGIIAVMLVMGIICYILSVIAMIPMGLVSILKSTLMMSDSPALPFVTLGFYILAVFGAFVTAFFMAMITICVAMLYGHAAEKVDNVSVTDDIDHFEQMADNNEDAPQLPDIDDPDEIDDFDKL